MLAGTVVVGAEVTPGECLGLHASNSPLMAPLSSSRLVDLGGRHMDKTQSLGHVRRRDAVHRRVPWRSVDLRDRQAVGDSRCCRSGPEEHPQRPQHPGWVTHDPAGCSVLRGVLAVVGRDLRPRDRHRRGKPERDRALCRSPPTRSGPSPSSRSTSSSSTRSRCTAAVRPIRRVEEEPPEVRPLREDARLLGANSSSVRTPCCFRAARSLSCSTRSSAPAAKADRRGGAVLLLAGRAHPARPSDSPGGGSRGWRRRSPFRRRRRCAPFREAVLACGSPFWSGRRSAASRASMRAWAGIRSIAISTPPLRRTAAANGAALRFSYMSITAALPGSIASAASASSSPNRPEDAPSKMTKSPTLLSSRSRARTRRRSRPRS